MAVLTQGPQTFTTSSSRLNYGMPGSQGLEGVHVPQRQRAVLDPDVEAQIGFQQQALGAKNAQWGQVYGQLQSMLGGMATAGGTNTPTPEITVGGVLNPQQVQQQVNQSRASNDQATAGRVKGINQSAAGRGFGSNSPLAMALGQAAQNQNLATNTSNETQTRLAARQQNAGHLLGTQQARANTWAQENQLDIERKKPYWQQQNALIAALAGMA